MRVVPFLLLVTFFLLIILAVYAAMGPNRGVIRIGNNSLNLNLSAQDLTRVLVITPNAATTNYNMPTVRKVIDHFNLNTGDSIKFYVINNSGSDVTFTFNSGAANDSYLNDVVNNGTRTVYNNVSYSFTLLVLGTYKDKGLWNFNTGFPQGAPSNNANTISVDSVTLLD